MFSWGMDAGDGHEIVLDLDFEFPRNYKALLQRCSISHDSEIDWEKGFGGGGASSGAAPALVLCDRCFYNVRRRPVPFCSFIMCYDPSKLLWIGRNLERWFGTPLDCSERPVILGVGKCTTMSKKHEVAFNLSLNHRTLDSISINLDGLKESEICGSLGSIERITVLDGVVLELQGTLGVMRLSMPERYLKFFEKQTSCGRKR